MKTPEVTTKNTTTLKKTEVKVPVAPVPNRAQGPIVDRPRGAGSSGGLSNSDLVLLAGLLLAGVWAFLYLAGGWERLRFFLRTGP